MARTPVGEKIRTLAALNSTLRTNFGTNPFRWMKWPLTQGYIPKKRGDLAPGGGTSSVRYLLVSSVADYAQQGRCVLERCRLQFDVLDLYPEICDRAAFAIEDFLGSINLVTGENFASPPTTARNSPNFLTNRREFVEPQTGAVIYGISIDVICFNSTLN